MNAQTISYGVVGGALLAGPPGTSPYVHREDKRYTFGPLIEIGLTKHISVEFSPLYKRLGFSETSVEGDPVIGAQTILALRERENAWEFPIVGKYYFGKKRQSWRPFVLTGYSFTKSWISMKSSFGASLGFSNTPTTGSSTTGASTAASMLLTSSLTSPLGVGAVFGGGIQARKGPAMIGPEFRYTRNGVSGKNQAEVLVSVRF